MINGIRHLIKLLFGKTNEQISRLKLPNKKMINKISYDNDIPFLLDREDKEFHLKGSMNFEYDIENNVLFFTITNEDKKTINYLDITINYSEHLSIIKLIGNWEDNADEKVLRLSPQINVLRPGDIIKLEICFYKEKRIKSCPVYLMIRGNNQADNFKHFSVLII